MNELTPTEIVAVKLFGWVLDLGHNEPGERQYYHSSGSFHIAGGVLDGSGVGAAGGEDFPDFNDAFAAPYWCDRMQRKLAAQYLFERYAGYVNRLFYGPGAVALTDSQIAAGMAFADPAQRLEAAVRVIREVGL